MKHGGTQTKYLIAAVGIGACLVSSAAYVSAENVSVTAIVASDVTATVQWAMPQGRVGAAETNDDSNFFLTVRTATNGDDVVLATAPAATLLSAGVDGTYVIPENLTVSPGIYDLGIKGHQHLTRVLQDVTLVSGNNVLNFTQPSNAVPKGSQVLLAGDVNGAGTSPATLGDDVVNSVDISTLLAVIDADDLTGNVQRPNLNQDVVVNSVDLSLMISNLDVEGEN